MTSSIEQRNSKRFFASLRMTAVRRFQRGCRNQHAARPPSTLHYFLPLPRRARALSKLGDCRYAPRVDFCREAISVALKCSRHCYTDIRCSTISRPNEASEKSWSFSRVISSAKLLKKKVEMTALADFAKPTNQFFHRSFPAFSDL